MLKLNGQAFGSINDYMQKCEINILDVIFILWSIIMVASTFLMISLESWVPEFIKQILRFGKHKHEGASFIKKLEVPKSWFKHFYVFGFGFALLTLYLIIKSIITQTTAPEPLLAFLDAVAGGKNRSANVTTSHAFVSILLMTLQCGRRFYESNFVQIFSKKNKINFAHYIVGYVHYFGVFVALLCNTQGFVRGTVPTSFSFLKISLLQYFCIYSFLFSWVYQYKSNMILVNLRKDPKTGAVKTEQHLLPEGGMFDVVTSPHMLFEVIMYLSLSGILCWSDTFHYIFIWVASNQVFNALQTHEWYLKKFENYPSKRCAIVPFIL